MLLALSGIPLPMRLVAEYAFRALAKVVVGYQRWRRCYSQSWANTAGWYRAKTVHGGEVLQHPSLPR